MGTLIETRSWPFSATLMTEPVRREGAEREPAIGGGGPARRVGPTHNPGFDPILLLGFIVVPVTRALV